MFPPPGHSKEYVPKTISSPWNPLPGASPRPHLQKLGYFPHNEVSSPLPIESERRGLWRAGAFLFWATFHR